MVGLVVVVLFVEAVDLAHGDILVRIECFNPDAICIVDDTVEDGFDERPFAVV